MDRSFWISLLAIYFTAYNSSAQIDTETNEDVNCIKDGFLPVPNNCTAFYWCSLRRSLRALILECDQNQIFDSQTQSCTFPWLSTREECGGTFHLSNEVEDSPSDNPHEDIQVSSRNLPSGCSQEGFLHDENDCGKFYRCIDNGRGKFLRYEFSCGVGTVWDPEINACNHPWATRNIKCGGRIEETSEGFVSPGLSENSESPNLIQTYPEIQSSSQAPSYPNYPSYQSSEVPAVPSSSHAPPASYPTYPDSNPYPPNENNNNNNIPQPTVQPPEQPYENNNNNNQQPSPQPPVDTDNNIPLGPESECRQEGFLGDSKDCKKFYRCVQSGNGRFLKYEFSCGQGTVWDPEIGACNHQWATKRSNCLIGETDNEIGNPDGSYNNQPESGFDPDNPNSGFQPGYYPETGFKPPGSSTLQPQQPISGSETGYNPQPGSGPYQPQPGSGPYQPQPGYQEITQKPISGPEAGYNPQPVLSSPQPGYQEFTNRPPSGDPGNTSPQNGYNPQAGTSTPKPGYQEITQKPDNPQPGNLETSKPSYLTTSKPVEELSSEIPNGTTDQTNVEATPENEGNQESDVDCFEEDFIPHPKNCKKFIRCVNNGNKGFIKYEFTCGDGTVWDSETKTCNHPSATRNKCGTGTSADLGSTDISETNGKTTEGSISSPTPSTEIVYTIKPSNEIEEPSTTISTSISVTISTISSSESSTDTSNISSTTNDYQHGSSTSYPEQSSTEINVASTTSNGDQSSTGTSNIPSTTETSQNTTTPENNKLFDECTQAGFIGDSKNCKKFYRCVANPKRGFIKYEFTCGEGTIWDVDQSTCNYPQATRRQCAGTDQDVERSTVKPDDGNEKEITTISSEPGTSSSSTGDYAGTSESSVTTGSSQSSSESVQPEIATPVEDKESSSTFSQPSLEVTTSSSTDSNKPDKKCKEEGFFGDVTDCKKFYRCVGGNERNKIFTKYEFTCGEGTTWDSKLGTCNYPSAVKNSNCGTVYKPEGSTPETSSEALSSSQTGEYLTVTAGGSTESSSSTQSQEATTETEKEITIGQPENVQTTVGPTESVPEPSTTIESGSSTAGQLDTTTGSLGPDSGSSSTEGTDTGSTTTIGTDPGSSPTIGADPGSTTTSNIDPGSPTTSVTEPGSSTTIGADPGSTTTSNIDPGSPTTSVTEPGSSTTIGADPGSTTTSNIDPGSPTTSETEPGSSTTSATEPELSTTSATYLGSSTIIGTDPGSSTTSETDSSTVSSTDTGSSSTSATDLASSTTIGSDPESSSKDQTDQGSSTVTPVETTQTGSTELAIQSTESSQSSSTSEPISQSTTPSKTTSQSQATPKPEEPIGKLENTCTKEGFFPNMKDCKKFYRCVPNGKGFTKYDFSCGPGTIWDPDLDTCNHPYAVSNKKCEQGSQQSTEKPTEKPTRPTGKPTKPTGKPTEKPTQKPTQKPHTEAPQSSQEKCTEDGFHPNTIDCKKFFRCVSNAAGGFTKYDFICPEGTMFDPNIQTCNYPYATENRACGHIAGVEPTTEKDIKTNEPPTETTTIVEVTTLTGEITTSTDESFTATDIVTQIIDQTTEIDNQTTDIDTQTPEILTQTTEAVNPTTEISQTTTETDYPPTTDNQPTTNLNQQVTTEDQTTITEQPTTEAEKEISITTLSQETITVLTTNQAETSTNIPTTNPAIESITQDNIATTPEPILTTTEEQLTTITDTPDQTTVVNQATTIIDAVSTTIEEVITTEQPTTTDSAVPLTEIDSETTTSEAGSTTDLDQLVSTTEEPRINQTAPCPISELEGDQLSLVCPTGFKRHPKYCNLFYQCTSSPRTMEIKILVLSCPTGTIFDDEKIQCLTAEESSQKCLGEIKEKEQFRKFSSQSALPMEINSQKPFCPNEGTYPLHSSKCLNNFIKCQRAPTEKRTMRAYVHQCPEGFTYWPISKRCEKQSPALGCVEEGEILDAQSKWMIPVEIQNISRSQPIKQ